jgi:hypothetical protein
MTLSTVRHKRAGVPAALHRQAPGPSAPWRRTEAVVAGAGCYHSPPPALLAGHRIRAPTGRPGGAFAWEGRRARPGQRASEVLVRSAPTERHAVPGHRVPEMHHTRACLDAVHSRPHPPADLVGPTAHAQSVPVGHRRCPRQMIKHGRRHYRHRPGRRQRSCRTTSRQAGVSTVSTLMRRPVTIGMDLRGRTARTAR